MLHISYVSAVRENVTFQHLPIKAVSAMGVCPDGSYLVVKHLISCNDVQLHTEKVIPGERERKRESADTAQPKA